MNKFKKRKLKRILITNKNKIIFAAAFLFVILLGVGYAAFSEVLTIVGSGKIKLPDCQRHVTGSFAVTGSWPGAERVTVYVDNYEANMLEDFTLELKVPEGTSAGPFNECINNTVDGYLYPSANGIITITLNHGNNGTCEWISKISGATTNNGVLTPGSWGGGNGFGFQLNNSIIDSNNTIEPTFINFEGCTIVGGENGNQQTPLSALGLSPATASIGIDERLNLTTTKTPAYKQVNLVYTSSDTSVATVDSNGSVVGISPGTATITVSAEGLSATSTITVESYVLAPESISITPTSYRLLEGEEVPLQTTITPSGAITELTWTSSNPSVATVDSHGNVVGISPGEIVITVTTSNGVSATCNIRVIEPAVSNDVDINMRKVIIMEGIMALEDDRIRELASIKIYVESDDDIRFIRRLVRDVNERGRTVDDVIDQYLSTVKPMYHEFVKPTKRYADIIIPNDKSHSIAVDVIVAKIKNILKDLDEDEEE